jgi:hypothetical protein
LEEKDFSTIEHGIQGPEEREATGHNTEVVGRGYISQDFKCYIEEFRFLSCRK